jgi:hypothetical protein
MEVMTVEFNNRYRDKIYFTDNGDGTVTMSGGKWLRFGYDEDPKIPTMVDPSGGPYISIGSNLNVYFKDKVDRIVDEITFMEHNPNDDSSTIMFHVSNN